MPIAPFEKKADGDAVSSFFPIFLSQCWQNIFFIHRDIISCGNSGTPRKARQWVKIAEFHIGEVPIK